MMLRWLNFLVWCLFNPFKISQVFLRQKIQKGREKGRDLRATILVLMAFAFGCASPKTPAPVTPIKPAPVVKPAASMEELQSCLLELGVDEASAARILATVPREEEVLPAGVEWGHEEKRQVLTTAWTKALEALAVASAENRGSLQVAAALLMQESLLCDIYRISCPLFQNEELKGLEQYRGQILVALGQRLRRFRQEHPDLPGVLAEQVLGELESWMTFSPEWDVAFSMDARTLVTNSTEVGEIPQEEQVEQCFLRCAEAALPVPENGEPLWYHWHIGGDINEQVTGLAIYLPVLPQGSQCVMNDVPQTIAENACTLLPVEWIPGEKMDIRLAIRLPEATLNEPRGRALFPVVLLQKFRETTGEK